MTKTLADAPNGPPPYPTTAPPQLRLPPDACDSHCHVFGPFDRYPLPADRSFTPNLAPETALRALHDTLGLARAVIVQSQGHGFDHRPMLDALSTGNGRYRGVALLKPTTSAETVAAYNQAGVCGTRFNFLSHLGGNPSLDDMRAVMKLVQPVGWHIAVHVTGPDLLRYADFIAGIEARVVIDHMARPNLDQHADACLEVLFRLLDSGRVWVKLSGGDRMSKTGAPYHDAASYANRIARHAPERVLWGTDWPHVNLHAPMPDDTTLLDLISEIAPASDLRQRMLVANPAELFGFDRV